MIGVSSTQFIVRRVSEHVCVITVLGDLTRASELGLLQAHAQTLAAGARFVVLNFVGMASMNSQGIAALVRVLAAARENRQRVRACCLGEYEREVFSFTRLDEMIAVYTSEVEAIRGEHGLRSREIGGSGSSNISF